MMKKFILFVNLINIFLLTALNSCNLEQNRSIVQDLTQLRNCEATLADEYISNSESGNRHLKKITVSKCEVLEKDLIQPELLASDLALKLLSKLGIDDRDFNAIQVELNKNNGESFNYEIEKDKLLTVEKSAKFNDNWAVAIKNGDVKTSYNFLNKKLPNHISYESYHKKFKELEEKYGKIDTVELKGFAFEQVANSTYKGNYVQFVYSFITDKGEFGVSSYVNLEDNEYKIYRLIILNEL